MDSPQGKSSPPPQVQDATGDHEPIQEQEQVPHVPEQDQGQAQPNGEEPILEAHDQAQVHDQDQDQTQPQASSPTSNSSELELEVVKRRVSPRLKHSQGQASSTSSKPSEEELTLKEQKKWPPS